MGRTVLEFRVPNRSPPESWQLFLSWFGQNGFEVIDPRSDGQEKILPRWDGDMVLHPTRRSVIAARFRAGGSATVFEFSIYPEGGSTHIHLEGYVTGRGPGWKGKEYEFGPATLAVAGVPRKQGLELLGSLQSYVTSATGASPAAGDRPLPTFSDIPPDPDGRAQYPPQAGTPSEDDRAARTKANRWTDRRIMDKPFPFESSAQLLPVPAARLQSRLSEVLFAEGFEVVLEAPPRLDGRPSKPGTFDFHRGLVVGERGLRIDRALRRRAIFLAVLSGVATLALMGVVFGGIAFGLHLPTVFVVPAGLLLGLTLIAVGQLGSFDSDLVCAIYAPSGVAASELTDSRLPIPCDLRIVAGSVASRNWAGKGSSGRNFKAFKPPSPQLQGLPQQIVSQINDSR